MPKPTPSLIRTAIVFIALSVTTLTVNAQSLLPGLRPPSPSGSFLAGAEAIRDLSTTDAQRFFMDAAESQWDNPIVVERAFEALLSDGKVADAAAMAPHVQSLSPRSELAQLVVGAVALKQRRYASAIKSLETVGADTFVGITGVMLRAWAMIGEGDYRSSQALLDEVSRGGLDEFLIFHRALMADVAGERDDALRYVELAYENESYVARIVEAYARVLANSSQFDQARRLLAEYRERGFEHALVQALEKQLEADVRPGKLASSVQAGAAEMFYGIGVALARDGTEDVAAMFLRLGTFLDPKSDIIKLALGELYARAEQYEVANELFQSIADASPLKGQALVNIAENFNSDGDRPEAIRRLRNLTVVDPENVDAVAALGDLLRYDENYVESAEAYTKALELSGGEAVNDWRYYYVRGIAYERQGEWASAEKDFLKALDLKPGQPQVLNYLGYSWVDQGLHLDRALEMITQAVEWDPSDGYVVDSLGWAFYKLGRLEEAVETLENAVSLRPADPEINDHLGDVYWSVGRKQEARFQWAIAIDLDENGRVRERAAPKLISGLVPEPKS